ncbi:MAG: hypothetical protein H3C45_01705 [Bacteroidia bacterium]|nr:hypothetical protein [Bacteroidia bacterium]
METKTTNLFETIAGMQKQAIENLTNATEQMQKNLFNNNAFDSETFKKWYDSQMAFFNKSAENKNNANPMEFFNTWMNGQMNMAKAWVDASNNPFMKNNMNMTDDMKKNYEQLLSFFSNWSNTMNSTYSEMLKNFNAGSTNKDAFSGMFNNAEVYMKMFQLWMPMLKSIQDKTFTPETFQSMFNVAIFKDIMDKMFNMQPDFMKNMTEEAKANGYKLMDFSKSSFDNFKNMMTTSLPNANEMFKNMYDNYTKANTEMNNALAPFMKLVSAGVAKQEAENMQELVNEFNLFNMKNAQMQYMIYTTGLKAMDDFAASIYNKVRNGEEITSFLNLYSEWLSTNDKTFVSLFESDEYSTMQSGLNSFGMKLKRNIDLQMEKAFANMPLINRSEMDALYKTIYELKKRISTLEKQIEESATPSVSEAKTSAKRAGKN